jgi:hypothetical protein
LTARWRSACPAPPGLHPPPAMATAEKYNMDDFFKDSDGAPAPATAAGTATATAASATTPTTAASALAPADPAAPAAPATPASSPAEGRPKSGEQQRQSVKPQRQSVKEQPAKRPQQSVKDQQVKAPRQSVKEPQPPQEQQQQQEQQQPSAQPQRLSAVVLASSRDATPPASPGRRPLSATESPASKAGTAPSSRPSTAPSTPPAQQQQQHTHQPKQTHQHQPPSPQRQSRPPSAQQPTQPEQAGTAATPSEQEAPKSATAAPEEPENGAMEQMRHICTDLQASFVFSDKDVRPVDITKPLRHFIRSGELKKKGTQSFLKRDAPRIVFVFKVRLSDSSCVLTCNASRWSVGCCCKPLGAAQRAQQVDTTYRSTGPPTHARARARQSGRLPDT